MAKSDDIHGILNEEDVLSTIDLMDFWKDKGASFECELCGSSKWSAAIQIYGGRPILPFKDINTGLESGFVEVVGATCQNCGNMRIFNRYVIEQWKKKLALGVSDVDSK